MNIEIANRLVKLRKEKGLSQEQLAAELGVSRQAVSKWETAAASPDTDNLICLAKLYNMSLDELLNNEPSNKEENKADEFDEQNEVNSDEKQKSFHLEKGGIHIVDGKEEVHIGFNGIHIVSNDGNVDVDGSSIKTYTKNHKKELAWYGAVNGILLALVTVIYLLLGFYTPLGWAAGWVLYFIPIIVSSIMSCVTTKRMSNFAYPILVTGIYCLVGILCNIWHPSWILFITIPIYYTIAGLVDKKTKSQNPKEFMTSNEDSVEVDIDEK